MSKKFEWLRHEIVSVKTRKFHVSSGEGSPEFIKAVSDSHLGLPKSYKEFSLTFGNVKLYRQSRDGYKIGVFAGPRAVTFKNLESAYHVGYYDDENFFIGYDGDNWGIYKNHKKSAKKIANTFEDWLALACESARKSFSIEEWEEILRGPPPFTSPELMLVENRKLFSWRSTGFDESGNRLIEVKNGGSDVIPILTIGARSKDGQLNGAFTLYVGHILPGQTAELRASCYKNLVPPEQIELFSLPDPGPEDRKYYAEFWN